MFQYCCNREAKVGRAWLTDVRVAERWTHFAQFHDYWMFLQPWQAGMRRRGREPEKEWIQHPFVLPPPCIFIPLSTWEYLTYAWRCQLWWVRLLLPRREWRELCHGNHFELGPPVSLWKKIKSLSKLDPHFTNPQRVGWDSPSLLFLLFSLHKAPQNPAAANWLLPVQQPMGKDWSSFAAC